MAEPAPRRLANHNKHTRRLGPLHRRVIRHAGPPSEAAKYAIAVNGIRELGEALDTHRKRQQATHPGLTPTAMYNVLEKLRDGETLSANERTIHEQGLVSVLRQLHDELDLAVLDAYTLERSRASAAGRAGQCDALVIELSGRRRGR